MEASLSGEFVNFMDDAEILLGHSKNNPSSPELVHDISKRENEDDDDDEILSLQDET